MFLFSSILERTNKLNGQRKIDKTHLSCDQAEERGFLHRDYIAHCLRWSHIVKHLGNKRLGGWEYPINDLDKMCQYACKYFKDFPIPVYKTVKESKLSLPLMNLGIKWTL